MSETLTLPASFRPMNREEMLDTHGGIWAAILVGLTIAAGAEIIRDWDNFKRGLQGLPEIRP